MKQLLFLIVAAAVYLHFYPNEEVTQFYNKQKQVLLSGFSDFANTEVGLKSDVIYKNMEKKLTYFSKKEIEHLKDITSSANKVESFYVNTCNTNKRDIVFHIRNEKELCRVISKYAHLL